MRFDSIRLVLRSRVAGSLVLVAVVAVVAGCSGEARLDPGVAAQIDGRDIPYSDFTRFLNETAGDSMDLQSAAIATLFESFLEEELLFTLAMDKDLLTDGADRAIAPTVLLASVESAEDVEVTEEDIERYYLEHQKRFESGERVRLQQILVQEKELAEQAWRDLEDGVSWDVVAASLEQDYGAVVGSQGELSRDEMPLAFLEPVFALSAGEYTRVLKAEYGYHLFLVEAKRPAGTIPLDVVRDEIERIIATERLDSVLTSLLEEAKERYTVKVADRNLPFERSES